MRAILVVYSLVNWLAIIKEDQKQNIKIFFQNVAAPWFQGFATALAAPDTESTDYGLKIAIMRVRL
jgi:hypothetical protein